MDYFGSETTIPYEPPFHPPAEDKVIVTPPTGTGKTTAPPSATTGPASKDNSIEGDTLEEQLPSKRSELTTIPEGAHVQGFTLLDNLYLRAGILYVVTPDESKFPPARDLLSRPLPMAEHVELEPTDKELQYLKPSEMEGTLGKHFVHVDGLSVIVYDSPQFFSHYYHWWGEIILGAWRILSFEGAKTKEVLKPKRFLLPFSVRGQFRDRAGVDGPLMRAAFPDASIEESDYWEDHIKLNATVVFDRVLLINRPAAHRHPWDRRWYKMIAGAMNITVPANFWTPIRQTLVQNTLGYVPDIEKHGATTSKPVVTYISRQDAGSRALLPADHEALVKALVDLEAEGICEFHEARMEDLSLREQIELPARSTIIIGVHGNGLTHQLWMPESPHSSIFEIFDPQGYIFDYELLARNMGHQHYGIWNDTFVTYPEGKWHDGVTTGENFHSKTIPVHAPAVIKLIKERLAEKSP
ncbi:hypothetical protein FPV67DRAFT_1416086 [Lyophyllum atratum]|nr:hypothetical protein FPV67DRAFT_1416086 [Lyophyllum atratum]